MLKYIFMGTPPLAATILQRLCESAQPPVAVVTQIAKAQGRGKHVVPSAVESYAKTQDLNVFGTMDVNAENTVEALRTFRPDLVLVAAFGQILKDGILTLPKLYCLNVHASLLPKHRGAAPVQRAIWEGDTVTGITIQKMAKKLDTGDILLARELNIEPTDTSDTLMSRLAQLGGECLLESLKLIESQKETFTPQDHTAATYAKKIDRADSPLNWNRTAQELERQIRALQPWPVADCLLGTERLKVFGATPETTGSNKTVGTVITDGKTFLKIACGQNTVLALNEVQPENRKRVDIRSFLNSFRGHFPYQKL